MKKLQKISFTGDKNAQRELARAHLMIVALALSLLTLLVGITTFDIVINRTLAIILGCALIIITLFSFGVYLGLTALAIKRKK
jgi:hypothetical protein